MVGKENTKVALKLIRLKSGEDIIADVLEDNGSSLNVKEPCILMPMGDGRGNKIQMGMVPWMPFSQDQTFQLSHDWIVLITTPNEEIEDNYGRVYGTGLIKPTSKILYS